MAWDVPEAIKAVGNAVGGVFNIGNTWIEGRNQRMKVKADAEAKVMTTASQSTSDWIAYMSQASQNSWKDEFWTVIFSIPLVMCFVPGGAQFVQAGFDAISDTPDWYQNTVLALVGASVGIRHIGKGAKGIMAHTLKKKLTDKDLQSSK